MEQLEKDYSDIAGFAATLTGIDFRYYSTDGVLSASSIALQTPVSLEMEDGLTEAMASALSRSAAGTGLIHTDLFARNWACTEVSGGILVSGPFLMDNDGETAIAAVLRLSGISHISLTEYYRSLPVRDESGAEGLVRLLLMLGNGLPGKERVSSPPRLSTPLHDPSLEDRIRFERNEIENLYALEKRILNIVSRGDMEGLRQIEIFLQSGSEQDNQFGSMQHLARRMPDNPLRLQRNLSIALNTLLRQAAEKGGLSPLSLHGISERFALQIERTANVESLNRLQREMTRSYVAAVRKLGAAGYSRPVRRAIQFVNDNLDARLNLEILAVEAGLHKVSLSRLFRKETGKTITSHIRKRRMEEACWYLTNSSYSVGDTAMMVGYNDISAFSKAFSREIGIPPGKYRSMSR